MKNFAKKKQIKNKEWKKHKALSKIKTCKPK